MNFNFDRWLCDYSEARDKNLYGDELDSAKAAWEAAWDAAQPKWQPIETAPKNRRVLLTNGELIATGRYRLPTIFDTKKKNFAMTAA